MEAQSVEDGEQYARARQPLVQQAEVTFKPAYNKYLTRAEIRENKVRYWRRVLYADTLQVCLVIDV